VDRKVGGHFGGSWCCLAVLLYCDAAGRVVCVRREFWNKVKV
jgi:hypothetical protein